MGYIYSNPLKIALREHPRSPPGKASDFIEHLPALLATNPQVPIIAYFRESGLEQLRAGNLDDQITAGLAELEVLGVNFITRYRAIECARDLDPDMRTLAAAAEAAKACGAVLVAVSTDRFIRSHAYRHNHNFRIVASVHEFQQLAKLTQGVTLATLLHPDAPPQEVHSNRIKIGQRAKGRFGGRPPKAGYKKKVRIRLQKEAQIMRVAGASYGEIARDLNAPRTNIQRWTKGTPKGCTIF